MYWGSAKSPNFMIVYGALPQTPILIIFGALPQAPQTLSFEKGFDPKELAWNYFLSEFVSYDDNGKHLG